MMKTMEMGYRSQKSEGEIREGGTQVPKLRKYQVSEAEEMRILSESNKYQNEDETCLS
jgi:hypothetical protein